MRTPIHKYFSLLAVFCLPALALAQATRTCTANDADKPAIVKTLQGMFAAAQADSATAFNAAVTPDFFMYDAGQRMEGAAIIGAISDQHKKGYKYVWTVTAPHIELDCNGAWIAYVNVGSVTMPDGSKTDMKWLESAVLVKRNDQWLVRFLHSTRAAEPPK